MCLQLCRLFLILFLLATSASGSGIPVSGRVLTEAGTPVPSGTASLTALWEGPFAAPAVKAAIRDGWFELSAPIQGMWRLTVNAPGLVPASTRLQPLLDPTVLSPVRLPADVGAPVSISDPQGRPLSAIEVRAISTHSSQWPADNAAHWRPAVRSAVTDDSGKARLPRLAAERLTLTTWVEGFAMVWIDAAESWEAQLRPANGGAWWIREPTGESIVGADLRLQPGDWQIGPSNDQGQLPALSVEGTSRGGVLVRGADRRQRYSLEERIAIAAPQVEIHGTVISATDALPVAGAWVWRPERAEPAARTDENGRFVLFVDRAEAEGILKLELAAEGFLARRALLEPSSDEARRLTLRPAAAVAGRVTSTEHLPQAGVSVVAPGRASRYQTSTYTDRQGRFFLGGLSPGVDQELLLNREDLRSLQISLTGLEPFELRDGFRLVMDNAPLLIGRVVNPEGVPLADAQVTLEGSLQRRAGRIQPAELGGDDDSIIRQTDQNGRFAATVTREGRLDLEIKLMGFAPLSKLGLQAVQTESGLDLGDLVLQPSAPVHGIALDPDRKPVAGARLYVFSRAFRYHDQLDWYLRFRRPAAITGTDGRFVIDGLHEGRNFDLVARSPGFGRTVLTGITAPTEEPIELRLRAAATLVGRVLDSEGTPVGGVTVVVSELSRGGTPTKARTGAQGWFELADVALGAAEITAQADGYPALRQELEITGDQEDLVLQLPAGFWITGRVVNPEQIPVSGAAIRLRPMEETGANLRASYDDTTDTQGRFRVGRVGAGEWRVEVNRDWFDIERQIRIDSDLELELVLDDPGEPLDGVVTDTFGQGLDGVRIQLVDAQGATESTVSNAAGIFRFPRVGPGTWRVRTAFSTRKVDLPVALAVEPQPIEVDGDPSTPEAELEVTVGVGATLRGRVSGLAEHELPRVSITAQGENAVFPHSRITVDAAGRFEIGRLAVGMWRMSAQLPGTGRRAAAVVRIAPGETETSLEIDFNTGLQLTGQVLEEGQGSAGLLVVVTDSFGIEIGTRTDFEGRFRISGLAQGFVSLEARRRSRTLVLQTMELSADQEVVLEIPIESDG